MAKDRLKSKQRQVFKMLDEQHASPTQAGYIKDYITGLVNNQIQPGKKPAATVVKAFSRLQDIDDRTDEGKMLIAALGLLTMQPDFVHVTPDEALQEIKTTADRVYLEGDPFNALDLAERMEAGD